MKKLHFKTESWPFQRRFTMPNNNYPAQLNILLNKYKSYKLKKFIFSTIFWTCVSIALVSLIFYYLAQAEITLKNILIYISFNTAFFFAIHTVPYQEHKKLVNDIRKGIFGHKREEFYEFIRYLVNKKISNKEQTSTILLSMEENIANTVAEHHTKALIDITRNVKPS